ncbi:hypothetical protein [Mesorhizobium sp. Root157]|uniref:hypothetical protein n=1 Tax=Mesorhizobium sp. Root157 TaxID=1736477 RepID=UPI00138F5AFC|nr:hypothetical protein [Mesorhizobium sp. Root157]
MISPETGRAFSWSAMLAPVRLLFLFGKQNWLTLHDWSRFEDLEVPEFNQWLTMPADGPFKEKGACPPFQLSGRST